MLITAEFEKATGGKLAQLDPSVDILNPLLVKELFERIAVNDLPFLMMGNDLLFPTSPVDLIQTKIAVPPICIRPSVVSEVKAGT